MRKLNPQNLKKIQSTAEARELGRKGGIASGESRREKKRLSEIYAEALAREYDIVIEPAIRGNGKVARKEKRKKLQGQALIDHVFGKIFSRCDSTTIQLLKNIGDLTEGQKYIHETAINVNENNEAIKELLKKHGISRD